MPARTKNSYTVPGVGTTTRGNSGAAKKFVGKGPAPSGTTKAPERSYLEVPTVTTSPTGKVSTSGFSSPTKAQRAAKRQRRTQRRVQRVQAEVRQNRTERRRKSASVEKRVQKTEKAIKVNRYTPNPAKAVISAKPNPVAKPETFQGKPTAGTPTRRELRKAANAGTLKVNKAGFATTPKVRKVGGELRRLQAKARSSNAPLPGLDKEGTKVARKVLSTGKRMGATKKELLAAAETGLVESGGFHNYTDQALTDADSLGWRQERTSIYGADATKPKQGARNFFSETKQQSGGTAGELAANVQRPAEQYRGRYDAVKPQAQAIVKAFKKGGLKPAQRKKLAATKAKAAKLGLKVGNQSKLGPPPKKVVKRFKAIEVLAKKIAKMNIPYVYGGGHNGGMPNPSEGLDCSSSSVYLLNKAGVKIPNITSGEFGNYLPPGPGAVTVFYNPTHVFLRIGDEYWGTSAGDSGAGGLGFHDAPSQAYLSQYSVAHVPGLGKKQALQLGIDPSAPTSFPGVSLSSSGTTATIDPGAGATQSKPGFSKAPIELTPRQKYRRTTRKLREAGVGGETQGPETSETIKALEAKYGAKAA